MLVVLAFEYPFTQVALTPDLGPASDAYDKAISLLKSLILREGCYDLLA